MKRILVIVSVALLFAPILGAQENTPAPAPPGEQQEPPQRPGAPKSNPPAQAQGVVPVPVPIAPPKPNGPVQKSLVRITATAVEPDYRAPWNAGGLQRGIGAGFVISGNRIMTNAHVVANSRYLTVERDGDPNKYPAHMQFIANDCDLALITVPAPDFFKNMVPLKFGGIPALESTVSAYGYPIGGERMSGVGRRNLPDSANRGTGDHRDEQQRLHQSSTAAMRSAAWPSPNGFGEALIVW